MSKQGRRWQVSGSSVGGHTVPGVGGWVRVRAGGVLARVAVGVEWGWSHVFIHFFVFFSFFFSFFILPPLVSLPSSWRRPRPPDGTAPLGRPGWFNEETAQFRTHTHTLTLDWG